MDTSPPVIFTVIGGFLGAGKTSLVNRMLANGGARRFAVMVNDFGALNIDESLVTRTDGKIMQLANGCICCSLAGGLVEAMISLMQYRDQFDHILIEASGVSNPSRIMDFARIDQALRCGLTIVLVDATRFAGQFADPRLHETLHDQLSSADIFLLTKTDLASEEQIAEARAVLAHHQPHVPIVTLLSDNADLAQLLVLDEDNHAISHHHHHDHDHMQDFNSVAFVSHSPVAQIAFSRICKHFSHLILRGKGIIQFEEGTMVWHQTGRHIDFAAYQDSNDSSDGQSRLIIIGVDALDTVSEALNGLGFTPYQQEAGA